MNEGNSDLNEWLHVSRIKRTLDRYFRALDERQFEPSLFRGLFTDTARIVRPDGTETVGPEAIATSHAATFAHIKGSQHILTNHDVSITGDVALVRANLVAVHLWKDAPADANLLDASFSAGGVIRGHLARGTDGWRIEDLRNDVVWRLGSNFAKMLQIVRGLSER